MSQDEPVRLINSPYCFDFSRLAGRSPRRSSPASVRDRHRPARGGVTTEAGGNPQDEPGLDLQAELVDRRYQKKTVDDLHRTSPDQVHTTRLIWPLWIKRDIIRQLNGYNVTEQDAINVLIEHGRDRCIQTPDFHTWRELRAAAIGGNYPDKSDFDEIQNFVDRFAFDIPTNSVPTHKRNVRIGHSLLTSLSALSQELGIVQSTLAQVFIIDGLRVQPDVIHTDLMDSTVTIFYNKLRKRVRTLAALLRAYEVVLSDDGYAALEEVDL